MELLIFALVVLIIAGVLIYCIDLLPLGSPFNNLAKVVIILIALIVIVQKLGYI